ncbi:hypothetical protein C8J57DRAFT_1242688 [Mycena rebaudengoi]|nr:hypothetical protein C8J57DRAFT_1242688 [Mycena rebaudengoi]
MASHRLRHPVPGFLKVDALWWAGGAAQRADLLMRCSGREAHGDAGCSAQRRRAERASARVWKIRERSLMRYENCAGIVLNPVQGVRLVTGGRDGVGGGAGAVARGAGDTGGGAGGAVGGSHIGDGGTEH